MDKKLKDAIHGLANDPIAFDSFLFPDSYPLNIHSRIMLREAWKRQQIWIEGARGTIKSYTIGGRYVPGRMLLQPGWKPLSSGPSYRQSKIPWSFAKELIYESPFLPDLVQSITASTEGARIELATKPHSIFSAVPASGPKIHGARADSVIFEEFFEYPKELYTRSVTPMAAIRRAGVKNQFIYLTTGGYEFQFAYEIRRALHERKEKGDPNVGFISITLDDARVLGLPMEWDLIEIMAKIDPDTYQQQYFNKWLADSGQFHKLSVMMREEIKRCQILSEKVPGRKYVAGFDIARSVRGEGDDSAFCVIEVGIPARIVFMKVWNGLHPKVLLEDMLPLLKRFDVVRLKYDRGGGGGQFYEDYLRPSGIIEIDDVFPGRQIASPFLNTAEHIYTAHRALAASFEEENILTPQRPEDDLDASIAYNEIQSAFKQLADLNTKKTPTGWTRFEAPSGRKKDKGYSLLYAYDAMRELLLPTLIEQQAYEGTGVIGSDIGSLMYPSWMNRTYG